MAGSWDTVQNWPSYLAAVHSIHLPSGKILIWGFQIDSITVARLWDQQNPGTFENVDHTGTDLFCAGHAHLDFRAAAEELGQVLVAGSNWDGGDPLQSKKDVSFFKPATLPPDQWDRDPSYFMNHQRWYPTITTLADGRLTAFMGYKEQAVPPPPPPVVSTIPEVYLPQKNVWSELPASSQLPDLYPFMFVSKVRGVGDKLVNAGPGPDARALDLITLTWEDFPSHPTYNGQHHGSVAIYEPGKVLQSGGAPSHLGEGIADAIVIDFSDDSPQWSSVDPMKKKRRNHNLVPLPDGTVLAVGGNRIGQDPDNVPPGESVDPVYEPEIFNPADGTWGDLLAPMPADHPRWYHSTAVLLKDATVLVAGGNGSPGFNTRSGDIFSPPYLDGSPIRCSIQSFQSEINYGDTFQVTVDLEGGSVVEKVSLLRLGAVTHSFDQNQRFVNLVFTEVLPPPTEGIQRLQVVAPANANDAPPGYYMLFVVNQSGVPCQTAAYIRVSDGLEHVYPESFNVTVGQLASGALSDLWQSDNQYVTIEDAPGPSPPQPPFQIEVETTSPLSSVAELTIKLEASCGLVGDQRIELFNYETNQWDEVDTRTATGSDSVVEKTVALNPNDYMKPEGFAMKARISWFDPGGPGLERIAKVDEVHWSLKPAPVP
ncbi:MAG: DUF1929 domain-containing protein [Armatimonadetes bacterium]|nr:DUF1929 domain-containing protein [Armatimonadota bacterium]